MQQMPVHRSRKRPKQSGAPSTRRQPAATSGSTIDQVAAAANVSTATVSRFFNSPERVKPQTAERVREAVARINYVPNLVAGGLASSRTRLVTALIPTISQSIFSSTIQSLSDALTSYGYSVMLALTGVADEQVQRQLLSIIGRRPDGIILAGTQLDESARQKLKQARITTIETWDMPRDPIDLVVGVSHHKIGTAIARYVLERGRRRAFVISASGPRAIARRTSFSKGMVESGAPNPSSATFSHATTFGQGRRAMAEHWDSGNRPDVVVCSSDSCAHGAMEELRSRGVRVPEDVAVIGFGDMEFAAELSPSLTTVKIDGAVIGAKAAEFLMLRSSKEPISRPVVEIGFTLVARASG
jgi:LacI family transcriptional regulator, gluconate utilization system Gnt-I transcriptional repressor